MLSTACTSCPASSSARVRCRPTKPAAPVTSILPMRTAFSCGAFAPAASWPHGGEGGVKADRRSVGPPGGATLSCRQRAKAASEPRIGHAAFGGLHRPVVAVATPAVYETLTMPPSDPRLDPGFDPPSPEGAPAPPPARKPKPEKPRRRRPSLFGGFFRLLFTLAAVGIIGGAVAAYGLYRHIAADLPDYRWLADYQPSQMSRIYAADSRLLAELAAERRVFMPIEAIPKRVQAAFVSAEDQRFWEHHGVDPLGILRAVVTNIEQYGTGRRMGGASTITQQVAKNMLVGADRTMMRKVREAILAIRIEETLPKERILELYLNEIFLGYQAYGVAAASQAYFNKGLDELTVGEIAFLGALPKAPNNYNPVRYPEAARARRDWVLDRMAEDGAITAEEAATAKREPIVPRLLRRPEVVQVGQHFTEEVRRELINRFGPEQTTIGGLVVRTSIEPPLQAATEQALRGGLLSYDRRRGGWRGPVARVSAGAADWMPQLEAVLRPGGTLPEWRLAAVLEVRDREAK